MNRQITKPNQQKSPEKISGLFYLIGQHKQVK